MRSSSCGSCGTISSEPAFACKRPPPVRRPFCVSGRLRRTRQDPAPAQLLQAGEVTVDLTRHVVEVSGRRVELTPSEFELLALLVREPGRVFSRLQLLE